MTYKEIKKQNGERFAQTLRNHHDGLLEIPHIEHILRYAGRDAEGLLPYLMTLLDTANDNKPQPEPEPEPRDPFELLEEAGYNAFHADTLKKQNSIKRYFVEGELLCTFNDNARFQNYHIVHAVKTDADTIKRKHFKGKEERQDEYGTSVISIQMKKTGGFISIKNRYNHSVEACDNTFDSNPDNIIDGLSDALKTHFDVDFTIATSPLPSRVTLFDNQIFKYNLEKDNVYFGDQVWVKDSPKGRVFKHVDRASGDALFDTFLFDNKTKTLINLAHGSIESFPDNFNRYYGGNRDLHVDKKGNLVLGDEILICAENSSIRTLNLPAFTEMSDNCILHAPNLESVNAPNLIKMGDRCITTVGTLESFYAPSLVSMGIRCLEFTSLKHLDLPSLEIIHYQSLSFPAQLESFTAPSLRIIEQQALPFPNRLKNMHAPNLSVLGERCFHELNSMQELNLPSLETLGDWCFFNANSLKSLDAPKLKVTGENCFYHSRKLKTIVVNNDIDIGERNFRHTPAWTKLRFNVRRISDRLSRKLWENKPEEQQTPGMD